MDGETRDMLGELCRAINDSLKRSKRVAASVNKLEGKGYELTLLLDATVLLSEEAAPPRRKVLRKRREYSLVLDDGDKQFLRGMRIALSDKTHRPRKRGGPDE